MNSELGRRLGQELRRARKLSGLNQAQIGAAIGMRSAGSGSYVSRLERGKIPKVAFVTVVSYLQACKVSIGKFMLELAQSGALGAAEAQCVTGFTSQDSSSSSLKLKQEKRAKAKLLYQKRWERETEDANIIAGIWREVQVAIQPLLPADDPTRCLLTPYLVGVRAMYRVWKQAVRGALNRDPTLDVQMAFDRIERAGLEAKTIPAAVRKTRKIVFKRLMELVPR